MVQAVMVPASKHGDLTQSGRRDTLFTAVESPEMLVGFDQQIWEKGEAVGFHRFSTSCNVGTFGLHFSSKNEDILDKMQ